MRTARLLSVAALAAALALPAAAQAKLPSFSGSTLAPGVGFGGAKLGQSRAAMKDALGAGVCTDFSCMYQDVRRSQLGYVQVSFEDGKRGRVSVLDISTGTDSRTGKTVFRTPLAAIEGAGGIHLGSLQRAVKAAYGAARAVRGAPTVLLLRDRKKNTTLFYFTDHRLSRVLIEDDRPRG